MTAVSLEHVRTRWRSLQPRERLAIGIGAPLVALMFVYGLLWVPLQNELARLRASVPQARVQLLQMRSQAQEIVRLRTRARDATASSSLLTLLERSAQEQGLRQYITRMEPEGQTAVRVWLDAVAFNTLVAWLAGLQGQDGVHTDNASISGRAEPGLVDARLLLRSAGG